MISGRVMIPKTMVVTLNCRRIMSPNSNKVAKNKTPLRGGTAPLAKGRFLVRSTILSRSRSHKSFTTHPAPRMITAPIINKAMIRHSCDPKLDIPPEARVMLQNPGSSKSQIPIGLSRRIK